jgi:hypothetical protein
MQDGPQERSEADAAPSGEVMAPVRFAGLVLDLGACALKRESGEAIPLTRGGIPAFAPVRQPAGPGREPRRDPVDGRQPAARALKDMKPDPAAVNDGARPIDWAWLVAQKSQVLHKGVNSKDGWERCRKSERGVSMARSP